MYKLHIFYIFITSFGPIFGQGQACIQKDTSLCYINEKYPVSLFSIEKKFDSDEEIFDADIPLSADMDGDCVPEFIVQAFNDKIILIIDSKTGITKWKINTPFIAFSQGSIAVADLDIDGIPELFIKTGDAVEYPLNIRGRIMCYNTNGSVRWISDQRFDLNFGAIKGKLALADFDQDGIPEVYVNNKIFNAKTGIKLADGGVNGYGRESKNGFSPEAVSIAAQLDSDLSDLELAAGFSIYKVKLLNNNGTVGNSMTVYNIQVDNAYRDGFTTVGDINSDGILDVIVTSPGKTNEALLYAYTLSNASPLLISKAYPPSIEDYIGPPFIGDITGLGKPTIVLTRASMLLAYSYNGTKLFQQDWSFITTDSSGATGLTMFDFNNDGAKEIVYRDETFLKILDVTGVSPIEVARINCYSWTGSEYPIVGDFNNNGHSKICITCSTKPDIINAKLTVFGSPDSHFGWAPARGIWNQYNYHVLNINDDLTVPRVQKNNATFKNGKFNNFYVQESLLDSSGFFNKPGASLTGKINSVNYNSNNDVYTVTFDIYNRADASARADSNLAVSFYNGDPTTTGALIGIYHTLKKIEAGDSLSNLQYTFSASNLSDLFMVINTTRNKSGAFDPVDFIISECDYTDNIFRTLVLPKDKSVNPCNYIDTHLCYIKEKFLPSKIILEKKIESKEDVYTIEQALLADMDNDCIPELIIPASDYESILIIDSKTGLTKWEINAPYLSNSSNSIAVADLDDDGLPEIFCKSRIGSQIPVNMQSKLFCYNLNGSLRWISDESFESEIKNQLGGSIALADFNQDGISEIYISNKIFNAKTGIKLADGGLNGIGGGSDKNGYTLPPIAIAAQLDNDSTDLELAAGYTVYKVIIRNPDGMIGNNMIANNIKINNEFRDGYTTVSDIDADGKLEIIVGGIAIKNNILLYAYKMSNGIPQLLAQVFFLAGIQATCSPPSIGDIKGNGRPSVLFARTSILNSYSYNGTTTFKLDWSMNVTDLESPAISTMFDFNNDGIQEIVYRDDTFLRIFNGSVIPPVEITKYNCSSNTSLEYPIIGDLDHTGHAKICVPCGSNLDVTRGKLTIFGPPDSLTGWTPARGVWNQYNYHVLNINDDLTVPRIQKNNATFKNGKYNNFFVQESLLDSNGMLKKPAASLTCNIKCINFDPQINEFTVVFDIYNRKDATIVADSNLAVSFYNGDPTSSGTFIGIYYTLKTILAGDSLLNLEFRFSASNLKDLFMVVNTIRNGSGVFEDKDFTQVECDYTDNISRTLELPKLDSIQAKICKGAVYQFLDTTIQHPGKYYRKLSNIKGCDSLIHILSLNTVDTIYTKLSIQACDDYQWNNKLLTQSGLYVFDTLNQFGCDSIISLDLIINTSNSLKIQDTACYSYYWNGQTYYNSGSYAFHTKNNSGCDSTITLDLFIYKIDTTDLIVESCNDYYWGRFYYNMSGYWKFDTLNRFGCDSMINLWLTIIKEIKITQLQTACDSLIWNGATYTQSGIYTDTTQSVKGCDSITTLQLTISKSNQAVTKQTSCDSYLWNGNTYTQSGTYKFTNRNVNGCDSIETLQLTINKSTNSTINRTTCDSLMWNNIVYKKSGTYQYTTLNASGCDSIAILNLIVNPSNQIRIQQTACNSYTWNGKTYTQSGLYNYQTKNSTGCDSIITLDLNIIPSSLKDTSITICDSIIFLNKTLNTKGNYTFTLKNTQGCDSVIHLNLNINSQNFKANVSICGSYQWNVNGITYDSSGIYIAKYTNQSACDSTYQLDLTIHKNYEIKEKAEVCNEYLWPVNKELYTQSGDYIYPLKTNQGCDSIIKLNLVVNSDFQHTDTVSTTDAYTWPVNQKTYPSSGTYKEFYQTKNGCDSIHLLLLSINKDISIYYPNVIHPGGLNSFFTIYVYGASATIKALSIYDRWGERIWQKQNFPPNELEQGWNGKYKDQDVMPGVYVWHAEIVLKDGSVIMEKGDVTVVR